MFEIYELESSQLILITMFNKFVIFLINEEGSQISSNHACLVCRLLASLVTFAHLTTTVICLESVRAILVANIARTLETLADVAAVVVLHETVLAKLATRPLA